MSNIDILFYFFLLGFNKQNYYERESYLKK
jgi:hypothetical protein